MHKFKKTVRVIFILTVLIIFSIAIGSLIGTELTYKVSPEYQTTPISYSQIEVKDSNFPLDKEYVLGGVEGLDVQTTNYLQIVDTKIQVSSENYHKDPVSKYIFIGSISNDNLISALQKKLNSVTADLKKEETDKYEGLVIENIKYNEQTSFNVTDTILQMGSMDIFMQNCNFYNTLDIEYNVNSKDYNFKKLAEFENALCSKYIVPDSPFPTACSDCFLYPVDKKHPLDSNYAIEVVATDGIPGGERFSKAAYPHLLDMYSAAVAEGHRMRITSAYRSYQDQQQVYEGWVQYEMGFGKSRAQAESDANTYSALPGFSEHQLGTTADISSLDCIGIETVCDANEYFWVWLRDHAYEYGFVMSYPPGGESKTGYIHEPWHYRFIGIELAKEYKEKYESRSYPAEFLRNKKLY